MCPNCQSPRNLKFLPTDYVGYDDISEEFFLMCDNESCSQTRMISKDGDKDGIESIRERLNLDAELIQRIKLLHGVKKINLNSTIPVTESPVFCDQYELTKEYQYYKEVDGTIKTTEKNFSFPDDEGIEVNTLLAPAVVVQFLHKLSEVLYE